MARDHAPAPELSPASPPILRRTGMARDHVHLVAVGPIHEHERRELPRRHSEGTTTVEGGAGL
eukprot:4510161-Prymnesium_polylepis.1